MVPRNSGLAAVLTPAEGGMVRGGRPYVRDGSSCQILVPATRCAVDHTRNRRNTGTKPAGICIQRWYKALLPPLQGDKTMPTGYDAPRRTETDDVSEDSLEDLTARRNEAQLAVVDVDESESADLLRVARR